MDSGDNEGAPLVVDHVLVLTPCDVYVCIFHSGLAAVTAFMTDVFGENVDEVYSS